MLSWSENYFASCDKFTSLLFIIIDFEFCNDLKSSGHVVTSSVNCGYGFESHSCFTCFMPIISTNFL